MKSLLRHSFYVLVLLAYWLPDQAQNRAIDSLRQELAMSKYDTARVNLMIRIASELIRTADLDEATEFADKSISLADRIGYQFGLGTAYCAKGLIEYYRNEFDSAIAHQHKSITLKTKCGDESGIAASNNNLGLIYDGLGDYAKAKAFHEQALQTRKRLGIKSGVAASYVNLAILWSITGNSSKATEYFENALTAFTEIGDQYGIAAAKENLGVVHQIAGRYDKALEYYFESIKTRTRISDKLGLATTYNNIGQIFSKQEKQDEAFKYYKKALEISRKINNPTEIAASLSNIGFIHLERNELDLALAHFEDALQMRNSSGDKFTLADSHDDIGQTYLAKKEFDKAQSHFVKALQIKTEINNPEGIMRAHQNLAFTYLMQNAPARAIKEIRASLELSGQAGNPDLTSAALLIRSKIDSALHDHASAYLHYKLHTQIKDSLFTKEKDKKITEIALHHEFNQVADSLKFEKALSDTRLTMQAALLENTKRNRNIIVGLLLALFAISAILLFKIYQRRRLVYQNQLHLMEIKTLKAQMNPHFIFNALNSIYNFVELNKTELATSYILKFSRLMRLILKNSMEPNVSLKTELEVLHLYVELERERLSHRFEFKVKVDKEIDQTETQVPPLIFQPFVENSIWHGISQRSEGGVIILEISKHDDMLNCTVTDNGGGRKYEQQKGPGADHVLKKAGEDKSYGLQLTSERIDVLHKMSKKSSKLPNGRRNFEITDIKNGRQEPEGVRVEFTLPYELIN